MVPKKHKHKVKLTSILPFIVQLFYKTIILWNQLHHQQVDLV